MPQPLLARADWINTLEKRVSSAAVILELPDERAVVVKAWYKEYWSLPGGVIDEGESPQQAAVREVAEEISLTLDPEALEFRWVLYRTSEALQTYQFTFYATISDEDLAHIVLQPSEIDAFECVTKTQVLEQPDKYGHIVLAWAQGVRGYFEKQV